MTETFRKIFLLLSISLSLSPTRSAFAVSAVGPFDHYIKKVSKLTGLAEENVRRKAIKVLGEHYSNRFSKEVLAQASREKSGLPKAELKAMLEFLRNCREFQTELGLPKIIKSQIASNNPAVLDLIATVGGTENLAGDRIQFSYGLNAKLKAARPNQLITALVLVHPEMTEVRGIFVNSEKLDPHYNFESISYSYDPFEIRHPEESRLFRTVRKTGVTILTKDWVLPEGYVLKVRGTRESLLKLLTSPLTVAARRNTPVKNALKYWLEMRSHLLATGSWVTAFEADPSLDHHVHALSLAEAQDFLTEEELRNYFGIEPEDDETSKESDRQKSCSKALNKG